jgi:hypothetical protein
VIVCYNVAIESPIQSQSPTIFLPSLALQAVYPDYVPVKHHGYWRDVTNQKKFFDELAIKWNIQQTSDWNKVAAEDVLKEKGKGFISRYYDSSVRRGNNIFDIEPF